jgi:hypothetical protein
MVNDYFIKIPIGDYARGKPYGIPELGEGRSYAHSVKTPAKLNT